MEVTGSWNAAVGSRLYLSPSKRLQIEDVEVGQHASLDDKTTSLRLYACQTGLQEDLDRSAHKQIHFVPNYGCGRALAESQRIKQVRDEEH